MNHHQQWDIFCKVIDNYGDAGVSWRLAKRLATLAQLNIRLWIDDLQCLKRLVPHLSATQTVQQALPNLTVHRWEPNFADITPAQVVIETFACHLPDNYVQAMAQQAIKPIWINLEYLSAESWTEDCHKLSSLHSSLPLKKYFFFPGFKTGGILREADLAEKQRAWQTTSSVHPSSTVATFLTSAIKKESENDVLVSLFSYDNPALPSLLKAWSMGKSTIHCLAPLTPQIKKLSSFFGVETFSEPESLSYGALRFHVLPFFTQEEYDFLLWICDLNFVRGEDSFVRGQLAAKPMLWHIYPQDDQAHLTKLNAFLDIYTANLDPLSEKAMRDFYLAWNTGSDCGQVWERYYQQLPTLSQHATTWTQQLNVKTDLATNLYDFVQKAIASR